MKDLIKKFLKNTKLIFVFFDIFAITLAVFLSFILRFDGIIPAEKMDGLTAFLALALFLTIPVFFLRGIYKISWVYVSITDLPTLIEGVVISTSFLGAALLFFRGYTVFEGFPRSVLFIYAILLLLLIGGSRFSKRIYWQLIRSSMVSSEKRSSFPSKFADEEQKVKTVLITGGAGYLGSILCRRLLTAGYKVKVFDKLVFGQKSIEELFKNQNFQFIRGDILDIKELEKEIFNVDAVVHLAAIVGEAACVARQDLAIRTNYSGTIQVARLCKSYGIKRFIYTSTCSTYGKIEEENTMKEEAYSRPVDFYGETKIYAERELLRLRDENFRPTILRLSTLYGLSPRMRFDLVVNTFTKKAIKDKKIFIFGGNQWRPLIHVSDAARAIQLSLEQPLPRVGNQLMNVGDNRENYLILDVGKLIKEFIPGTKIEFINDIKDNRSYQVNFDKIEKLLHFQREKTVKDGILEISQAIKEGKLGDVENKLYYNHLVINSD